MRSATCERAGCENAQERTSRHSAQRRFCSFQSDGRTQTPLASNALGGARRCAVYNTISQFRYASKLSHPPHKISRNYHTPSRTSPPLTPSSPNTPSAMSMTEAVRAREVTTRAILGELSSAWARRPVARALLPPSVAARIERRRGWGRTAAAASSAPPHPQQPARRSRGVRGLRLRFGLCFRYPGGGAAVSERQALRRAHPCYATSAREN